MNFAILDIEATGGKKGTEKIIDIAIYQFDGEKVTDQFASMVNPEREIDKFVQNLTGITQKMVRRAPKFHELAKRIVEITKDCVIVGHGVDFDYRMLRQEFQSLGYNFEHKTLDTLTLSHQFLPNLETYSLGKLCKNLGIPLADRHRAAGDTRATLELFKILLKKDKTKNIIKAFGQNDPKSKQQISKLLQLQRNLPTQSGIYYYLDADGEIFYLQAARNIQRSVNQDFTSTSKKSLHIQTRVKEVHFEITGSFFIALLMQMEEEINHQNLIKNEQNYFKFGLFLNPTRIEKLNTTEGSIPFLIFPTKNKAYKALDSCETTEENLGNNEEISQGLKNITSNENHFILIDKGRTAEEKSFIEIEKNEILGFGFFKFYNQLEETSVRHAILVPVTSQEITPALVRSWLNFHHFKQKISFKPGENIKLPKENDRKRSKNFR